jgi:hypothetical protein
LIFCGAGGDIISTAQIALDKAATGHLPVTEAINMKPELAEARKLETFLETGHEFALIVRNGEEDIYQIDVSAVPALRPPTK